MSVRQGGADLLVRVAPPAKRQPVAARPAPAQEPVGQEPALAPAPAPAPGGLAQGETSPAGTEAGRPLGGWAQLSQGYGRGLGDAGPAPEAWRGYTQAILASEDAGPLRAEDLPPVEELAAASEETLVELLGFPEDVAKELEARVPRNGGVQDIQTLSASFSALAHPQALTDA